MIITNKETDYRDIVERLEKAPDTFSDADLIDLMKFTAEYSRGRAAKICPLAFLIFDKRHPPHSPTTTIRIGRRGE